MILETDDKLRRITTISTQVVLILSFVLLLTYTTFVNFPQSSFAQTDRISETNTKLCKIAESTLEGHERYYSPSYKERYGCR